MEVQHPYHEHPLLIQSDECPCPNFMCRGCSRPYEAPIYGCRDCNFYLHKSCAEFPEQTQSALHPPHLLTLQFGPKLYRADNCSCCGRSCERFSYSCAECDYLLDLECASLSPLLRLRDPVHHLCLLEKVPFVEHSACSKCGEEFGEADMSPVFICLIPKCRHALHFHCAPLSFPETAPRHYFHNYHDIIYVAEPLVEIEGDQYSGNERYCDVCEERRNPKLPIYYDKECNFGVHVYCAVSEVLPSLVEKYESSFLERNVCIDAFLNHFKERVSYWLSQKESCEASLVEKKEEFEVLRRKRARIYGRRKKVLALINLVAAALPSVYVGHVNKLLSSNFSLLLFLVFLPLILLWPLHVYQRKHPMNFAFFGLFSMSLSFNAGVSNAKTDGVELLKALIFSLAVEHALTKYAVWASNKKSNDLSFLYSILCIGLFVLLVSSFLQVFCPPGPILVNVCGSATAVVFAGFMVYDIATRMKRFPHEMYMRDEVTFYLDKLNLLFAILRMIRVKTTKSEIVSFELVVMVFLAARRGVNELEGR